MITDKLSNEWKFVIMSQEPSDSLVCSLISLLLNDFKIASGLVIRSI